MWQITRVRCVECNVSVREDRIEQHLKGVHPGTGIPKARLSRRYGVSRKQGRVGKPGVGGRKRRWIFAGIAVAIFVLVLYAILRAPPLGPQNGTSAPDFSFTSLQGATNSLSSYAGTPIVLWFVALFCSSCIQGSQLFGQQYYSQYHAAGVTLLEIESYNDLGQSGPSLSAFSSEVGYSGQAGWVMGASDSQGTNTYNSNGYLDVYYVINAQGTIVGSGQGLSGAFGSALEQA